MLALADQHGEVQASVPGLGDMARVSISECEEALDVFLSPDRHSRTKTHEGRRIEPIDGGWVILNYGKHRDLFSLEHRRALGRERAKRFREKVAVTESNAPVTTINDKQYAVSSKQSADTEAREEEEETVSVDIPDTSAPSPSASSSLAAHFADETHRTAYLAYRTEHRFPPSMDASILAVAEARTGGTPVPWDAVGSALADMRGAQAAFSPRALAGFARKAGAPAPNGSTNHHGPTGASRQDRNLAAIAEGMRRHIAAHGDDHGES